MYLNEYNQLVQKYERDMAAAKALMEQMAEEIGMPLDDYSDVRTSLAVLVFDAERERENLDGTVHRSVRLVYRREWQKAPQIQDEGRLQDQSRCAELY